MDNEKYFCSITAEIKALQNRVRNYITNHWLSDGQWKESIIKAVLRRHLPRTIGIGTGFVVSASQTSTQIDILLYDTSLPILFQDGDFVIVTPDAVRGMIEVKTKIKKTGKKNGLEAVLKKMADNIQMIPHKRNHCFFGVFAYQAGFRGLDTEIVSTEVLNALYKATQQNSQRIMHCLSIGDNFFVRYWGFGPQNENGIMFDRWHAYNLKNKAPAYFAHNVIDHLCPEYVSLNNNVWYPRLGKEGFKISEKKSDAYPG